MKKNILIVCIFLLVGNLKAQQANISQYSGIAPANKLLIFTEEFNDNLNSWQTRKDSFAVVTIDKGEFTLEAIGKKNVEDQILVPINQNNNFEIEILLKHVKGNPARAVGIHWGKSSKLNKYYSFLINAKKSFAISKYNGANVAYVPPKECKSITTLGYNKLSIRKYDNMLYFFINEEFVYSMLFKPFFGNEIGIQAPSGTQLAVDHIRIYQLNIPAVKTPPEIVIEEPVVKESFAQIDENANMLKVTGYVKGDNKINSVKINDFVIKVSADGKFSTSLPLTASVNTVKISASDDILQSTSEFINLNRIAVNEQRTSNNGQKTQTDNKNTDIGTPNYKALIIGVADYEDDNIIDLSEPINDAKKLKDVLLANYKFAPNDIILLQNPTYADMIEAFDDLSNTIKPNDNLLIFYAGHGIWDEEKQIGYWVPSDATASSSAYWFRVTVLLSYLETISSKHTLIITDACFAGSIFKSRKAFKDADKSVEQLYSLTSRKAMTSGMLNEVPDKSVFLKYLLKNLTENPKKYLPTSELFNSIREAVLNNTDNVPQFGVVRNAGDEGGEFIFVKK